MKEIKIGVSACLLGERLRYDGGHKLDRYITEVLGAHATLVPVCPEAESGLGVPREPMSLVGDPLHPRLVTNRTRVDRTGELARFCRERIAALGQEKISGFVLKRNSPSCGLFGVPVYGEDGARSGSGLFAAALATGFPHLPMEQEDALADPARRENFIERIFAYRRWLDFCGENPDLGLLVDFHSREKLVLMSHSVSGYRDTGRLVALAKEVPWPVLMQRYAELYFGALKLPATVKKQTNVLQHVLGYFKRDLDATDKGEAVAAIADYHHNLVPLIVPLTLLGHYALKYDSDYLKRQLYLFPHPSELMLRYHA